MVTAELHKCPPSRPIGVCKSAFSLSVSSYLILIDVNGRHHSPSF